MCGVGAIKCISTGSFIRACVGGCLDGVCLLQARNYFFMLLKPLLGPNKDIRFYCPALELAQPPVTVLGKWTPEHVSSRLATSEGGS